MAFVTTKDSYTEVFEKAEVPGHCCCMRPYFNSSLKTMKIPMFTLIYIQKIQYFNSLTLRENAGADFRADFFRINLEEYNFVLSIDKWTRGNINTKLFSWTQLSKGSFPGSYVIIALSLSSSSSSLQLTFFSVPDTVLSD